MSTTNRENNPDDDASFLTEPIHILGAGSIGLLFAASIRLTLPNYPIQLLLRDHHVHRIEEGKLVTICIRQSMQGKLRAPRLVQVPAQIINAPGNSNNNQRPIRNLIVTTKAFQAVQAIESVLHRINESTKIVILCNGALAVREELQEAWQQRWKKKPSSILQVQLGWTSHGAYREADSITTTTTDNNDMFHVIQAGFGQTAVENYESLARLWTRVGLNCSNTTSSEMLQQMWCKLAANCAINPLTAIYQCRNGELLNKNASLLATDYNVQDTIRQVVAEVARVAQVEIDDTRDLSEKVLSDFVMQVINDTASNKSSMYQDVVAKRRTEIDYLNGYVVKRGQVLGVSCPVNDSLCKHISALS
jgi:2-dehydropantoate 2-reductase